MHSWYIEIGFKNGLVENGIFESNDTSSTEVAKKLFEGQDNQLNGLRQGMDCHLLFKLGDVSFVKIKPYNKI